MSATQRDLRDPVAFRDALASLARNLRWTWRPEVGDIFAAMDQEAWAKARGNPWLAFSNMSEVTFSSAAATDELRAAVEAESANLTGYLDSRWKSPLFNEEDPIAYFSPEFGLHETLPIYSGGLGILAGDHLKAASDKGVALVGVGLLYRRGYFSQSLDESGWQHEDYPEVDPEGLGLTPQFPTVSVDLAGRTCELRIWTANVGCIDLVLLDSDVDSNAPEERSVTDRLYSGDNEHRLRQEIVLGIGGVRALRSTGYAAETWHLNEGHAAFMGLERAREAMVSGDPVPFYRRKPKLRSPRVALTDALDGLRRSTVFTTHTPLPVAIDVFERDLMERYFSDFAAECGTDLDSLIAAGSSAGRPDVFNMAFFGLRIAGRTNGVSELHGDVSRKLFAELWPATEPDDIPIGSVTNGVHAPTWVGPETRALAPEGWDPSSDGFSWAQACDDSEMWAVRKAARARLVESVRARLQEQLEERDASDEQLGWASTILDPDTLTIGFARRFAQYKRATLMLTDPGRLKRMMFDERRPLQIVVAGKAHPKDEGGKEFIRRLFEWTLDTEVRGRIVFLEDYDMALGRVLTQGVDVWLNNPRRPLEACGTSGMKAILNGIPNLSVLDGWWDEMYEASAGWAIGGRDLVEGLDAQDAADAESLYGLLEDSVIPEFYERDEDGVSRAWVARMKGAWALADRVSASRMIDDYVKGYYLPDPTPAPSA